MKADVSEELKDPRFADIITTKTRAEMIQKMNDHFVEDMASTEALNRLIWVGGMVEHAIASKLVPRQGIEIFIGTATPYSGSYIRMGRRFFNAGEAKRQRALKFYCDNDAEWAATDWQFKVEQPTGVVLLRDALKALDAYDTAPGSHLEKLAAVDEAFPMERDPTPDEQLTATKRRFILKVQAKERSTTQRRGNNTKPLLACGSLTTISSTPCAAAASAGFSPS